MSVAKIKVEGKWISIHNMKGPKGDTGLTGPAGEKGADGKDGYTPIKGVDYYTKEDRQEIVDLVLESLPNSEEVSY